MIHGLLTDYGCHSYRVLYSHVFVCLLAHYLQLAEQTHTQSPHIVRACKLQHNVWMCMLVTRDTSTTTVSLSLTCIRCCCLWISEHAFCWTPATDSNAHKHTCEHMHTNMHVRLMCSVSFRPWHIAEDDENDNESDEDDWDDRVRINYLHSLVKQLCRRFEIKSAMPGANQ